MNLGKITSLVVIFFLGYTTYAQLSETTISNGNYQFQPVTKENIFQTEGYYNWGGSILKDPQGMFHLFYSRWKKEYSFSGWLLFSEIAHAVSDQPTGPWQHQETVMKGRGGNGWDAITAHNPKVKYFEGKYYLYYIATRHPNGPLSDDKLKEIAITGGKHPDWKPLREAQRTGVAVASSLTGPWERSDEPLLEPSGPITTLVVNPAITQGGDGRYYLIVKGDKPNETRFIRNQAMAVGDHPDGPFEIQPKAVIDDLDTEDMSLWFDEKEHIFHGVFHAHQFIGHVQSKNGLAWEKGKPFVITPKKIMLQDGSTLVPDRMERPFIYEEKGEPKVLSVAVKKGDESFLVMMPIKKN